MNYDAFIEYFDGLLRKHLGTLMEHAEAASHGESPEFGRALVWLASSFPSGQEEEPDATLGLVITAAHAAAWEMYQETVDSSS